jgi:hypothetical protein
LIEIDVQTGFFIYLFIWFAMLAFLWGRELWRDKIYDWALSEGKVCICEECHFAFLIKPNESISRCPRCDEMCTIRKRY